ncbi:hypothetical protein GQ42DRAFT_161429 [Ramicandelaber brevisporus]|nr:hypothetical protein GQ42DRAFT_161429 [Ramicandelaber brevisporus]
MSASSSAPTALEDYSHVKDSLAAIQARVTAHSAAPATRLVAVSKTKPAAAILAAYNAGHRHFGENYVQELVQKSSELPRDISWHFIGKLQGNKCKALAAIPNLWAVETIDSEKRARQMDDALQASRSVESATPLSSQLNVFIQVNTSGEESKGGVGDLSSDSVCQLARFIHTECSHLKLRGLMTIGAPDSDQEYSTDGVHNPDFVALVKLRKDVAKSLDLESEHDLELSMGMSGDFEHALDLGATNVRVGSSIFGARNYNNNNNNNSK